MTQQIPVFMEPTDRALLEERIRYIDRLLRTSTAFLAECQQSPRPKSTLATEENRDPNSYAWGIGWQTFDGACDHFEGLIALTSSNRGLTRYAPYTMTRGALEAVALTWWLFDRTLTPHERLARAFGERVTAMDQRAKVRNPTVASQLEARRSMIVAEAAALGVTPRPRLGMTDLLVRMFPGGPPGAMLEPGRLAYHVLSGYSHAQLWALMLSGMRIPGSSEGDVMRMAVMLNVPFLTLFIDAAVSAYNRVVEDVCVHAGRPTSDWHAARGETAPDLRTVDENTWMDV